jgi:hypothetical protein
MPNRLMRLMEEKAQKGKKMSDSEKLAKISAVKDLESIASKMMGDKVSGLKKVSVAAPSPEGLEKGLEVAKNIVKKAEDTEESDSIETQEDSEEVEATEEDSEESEEDKIARLEEELASLKMKMKG